MLFNWNERFIVDTTNLGLQPSVQKTKRLYVQKCFCCNFSLKLVKIAKFTQSLNTFINKKFSKSDETLWVYRARRGLQSGIRQSGCLRLIEGVIAKLVKRRKWRFIPLTIKKNFKSNETSRVYRTRRGLQSGLTQ